MRRNNEIWPVYKRKKKNKNRMGLALQRKQKYRIFLEYSMAYSNIFHKKKSEYEISNSPSRMVLAKKKRVLSQSLKKKKISKSSLILISKLSQSLSFSLMLYEWVCENMGFCSLFFEFCSFLSPLTFGLSLQ